MPWELWRALSSKWTPLKRGRPGSAMCRDCARLCVIWRMEGLWPSFRRGRFPTGRRGGASAIPTGMIRPCASPPGVGQPSSLSISRAATACLFLWPGWCIQLCVPSFCLGNCSRSAIPPFRCALARPSAARFWRPCLRPAYVTTTCACAVMRLGKGKGREAGSMPVPWPLRCPRPFSNTP